MCIHVILWHLEELYFYCIFKINEEIQTIESTPCHWHFEAMIIFSNAKKMQKCQLLNTPPVPHLNAVWIRYKCDVLVVQRAG